MKVWKKNKVLTWIVIAVLICLFIFTIWINASVTKLGRLYSYDLVDKIPHNHVGIVLGTSKYRPNGKINLYYSYRIKAAADLFKSKKIDYIIVSGDNRHAHYNEPIRMFNDLVSAGIPKEKIILDYAGFRTFDSVIRGKEVFGQNRFTVISQPFHNYRAVYIARKRGINAVGFNAQDVSNGLSLQMMIRETGARVLLLFDLIIERQPHFLGQKIEIPD